MIRRSYNIRLGGGPFDTVHRTITDVTLPPCYTEWDPVTGKMALYRLVHAGVAPEKLDGRYRYNYAGVAEAPATVKFRAQELQCSYCGSMYSRSNAKHHFIPCDVSGCPNDLEHPGCCH